MSICFKSKSAETTSASATCATSSRVFVGVETGVARILPLPFDPAKADSVDNIPMPATSVPMSMAGTDAAESNSAPTGNSLFSLEEE